MPPTPVIPQPPRARRARPAARAAIGTQTAADLAPLPRTRGPPNPNNRILFIFVHMEKDEDAPHKWTICFAPSDLAPGQWETMSIHNANDGSPLTLEHGTLQNDAIMRYDSYSSVHRICEYPILTHERLKQAITNSVNFTIRDPDRTAWRRPFTRVLREWGWIPRIVMRILNRVLVLRAEAAGYARRVPGGRHHVWTNLRRSRVINRIRAEERERERREEQEDMVRWGEIPAPGAAAAAAGPANGGSEEGSEEVEDHWADIRAEARRMRDGFLRARRRDLELEGDYDEEGGEYDDFGDLDDDEYEDNVVNVDVAEEDLLDLDAMTSEEVNALQPGAYRTVRGGTVHIRPIRDEFLD
ncbi:uncharacterized protein DSM5745_04493 [Aspergillus mulundensis]|uniref:Uncharacterized protein n=1 Tax=Aspergillus mulundensis TaxID=1810919 RepID=A0A3D8SCU6_9EURO|nr:hypothetical protein DSM5745_04493 [Aspergillus mulundensis]RDW84167.1 hypothetical protein DSM5745_04493 [Aspergillus mulundensis]